MASYSIGSMLRKKVYSDVELGRNVLVHNEDTYMCVQFSFCSAALLDKKR
jgi:hypothetical protein